MTRILAIGILISLLSCEESTLEELAVEKEIEHPVSDKTICYFYDPIEYPTFPGGVSAMHEFVKENIIIPPACAEGRVFVQFVVEKEGAISEVRVVRGLSTELDAEAIRLVKSFPRFTPGKQQGIPMRMQMIYPVTFKL